MTYPSVEQRITARLNKALTEAGTKPYRVAVATGIPPSTMDRITKDAGRAKVKDLLCICAHLNVPISAVVGE